MRQKTFKEFSGFVFKQIDFGVKWAARQDRFSGLKGRAENRSKIAALGLYRTSGERKKT